MPPFLADLDPTIYLEDNYLVIDFEIDVEEPDSYGHSRFPANRMHLACWKHANGMTTCAYGDELHQGALLDNVASAGFMVCHNCKFEFGWLKRMGVELRDVFAFDTLLGEYVLLGNLAAGSEEMGVRPQSLALGAICERRGLPVKDPSVDVLISDGVNPAAIPKPWLTGRCRRDVETTEQIFLQQRKQLNESGRLQVAYARNLVTPLLADIESEPLAVSPAAVNAAYKRASAELATLNASMVDLVGSINTRSPTQMARFLYDKPPEGLGFKEITNARGEPKRNAARKAFPEGTPKTDNRTLDELRATTAKQKAFLALRKSLGRVRALISKNLAFFKGTVDDYAARFYGEILQTATATHRLSSRGLKRRFDSQANARGVGPVFGAQLQNIPRSLKGLIVPSCDGWLIADIDLSQGEFRAAAILGQDKQAEADINDPGFDSHVWTATQLFSKSADEVRTDKVESEKLGRDSLRQKAKPHTFKPLYGGQSGTPDEQRYYRAFRNRYRGIARTQAAWINAAVEKKETITPWGLRYFWPTAKRGGSGYVNVSTAVSNYAIQALATAEIAPTAAVYLWHVLRLYGIQDKARIINLVHDSSPTQFAPEVREALVDAVRLSYGPLTHGFLKTVYKMDLGRIPIGVGIKIGKCWGSGKEETFEFYADGTEVKKK